VLDLDTAGDYTRASESHLETDYSEMVLTIASLRRMVCNEPQPNLIHSIEASYYENLSNFGANPKWTDRAREVIATSDCVAGAVYML